MTPAHRIKTLLLFSLSLVASGALSASTAYADEIVIYRLIESLRGNHYFTPTDSPEPDTAGGRERFSEKSTGYVILNKTTGNFRQVFYYTETVKDINDRNVRVKRLRSSGGDHIPAVLFETDMAARANYLILSLFGTGDGNNFGHFEDEDYISSEVQLETLAGRIRLQKIRTQLLGLVECLTPSILTGLISEEAFYDDSLADEIDHYDSTGRKTLRLDKRRTREFIETGGSTLDEAQLSVENHLISKGYFFPMTM